MQRLAELSESSKTPIIKLVEQVAVNYKSPPIGTPMVAMPDGTKDFVNASIPREKYEAMRDAASIHGVPKGTALYNALLDYIAASAVTAPAVTPDVTPAESPAAATMATLKKRASPKFQL